MSNLKFKSGWYEIPEWAKWLAQDGSGQWWAYSLKPQQRDDLWFSTRNPNCFGDFICKESEPADWTQELYRLEWS